MLVAIGNTHDGLAVVFLAIVPQDVFLGWRITVFGKEFITSETVALSDGSQDCTAAGQVCVAHSGIVPRCVVDFHPSTQRVEGLRPL